MSNKYDKLLLWARFNGAIIPETLLFPSHPYGHCRTTIPIEPGTQLFHIPHKILLTPTVATTAFPQLQTVPVRARICAFIALERAKQGFWKEYFDSLPQEFSTPPYFNDEELELLRGTNLSFAWRGMIATWKTEFEQAKEVLPELQW